MTLSGRLTGRVLGGPVEFARNVAANVVANLMVLAIGYLAGVAAGLLPPSRWLNVASLVVIVVGPVFVSDLIVDRGGYVVRRVGMALMVVLGLGLALYPWIAGVAWSQRIWMGLIGVVLGAVSAWLLTSHLRDPWGAWRFGGDPRPARFPTMTWYAGPPDVDD
jgi:hypothetical protein